MAYAKGVEAVLKIGSDSIAQTSSWSIDVTQDTVECSAIGATTKPPIIGDLEPSDVIDSTYFFC